MGYWGGSGSVSKPSSRFSVGVESRRQGPRFCSRTVLSPFTWGRTFSSSLRTYSVFPPSPTILSTTDPDRPRCECTDLSVWSWLPVSTRGFLRDRVGWPEVTVGRGWSTDYSTGPTSRKTPSGPTTTSTEGTCATPSEGPQLPDDTPVPCNPPPGGGGNLLTDALRVGCRGTPP